MAGLSSRTEEESRYQRSEGKNKSWEEKLLLKAMPADSEDARLTFLPVDIC